MKNGVPIEDYYLVAPVEVLQVCIGEYCKSSRGIGMMNQGRIR